jgi:hypothetical protein
MMMNHTTIVNYLSIEYYYIKCALKGIAISKILFYKTLLYIHLEH